MICFSEFSERERLLFESKEINTDDILLFGKCDMGLEGGFCDTYLTVTGEALVIISGTYSLPDGFVEQSYKYFSLNELGRIKIEELISGARMTSVSTDGCDLLLCNFSNTYKNEMFRFSKYLNRIIERDGKDEHALTIELDEEDRESMRESCPKCGQRYPDPHRKVCPHCMDKMKLLKRSGVFISTFKGSVLALVGLMVLMSALSVITPYLSSGFYYDKVLDKAGPFYGELLFVISLIVGTKLFTTIVTVFNDSFFGIITTKLIYQIKKVIFDAIKRLSINFFSNRQTGGLMNQINGDAETIYAFSSDGLPFLITSLVQIFIVLVIMFVMSPILALVSIVFVPFFILAAMFIFGKFRKLHAKRYSSARSLNGTLSDILSGFRVVKAFAREDSETRRFDVKSKRLALNERTLSLFGNTAFPLSRLILTLCNLSVWGVGGYMVIKGHISYGVLMSFIAYMAMVFDPLFRMVDTVNSASDCMNALQRLFDVMDAVPEVVEKENPVVLDNLKGQVTFKNVEFSYVKNHKVIDNVSFDIEPGRIIGIVGHTGAGKSTIANLLIRLYDVEDGEILVDGVNVKDVTLDSLHKNIAIVSQETYLFIGTLYENIKYACPDATYEQVIEASKIAGAHDFIMQLPDAYNTMIGFGYKNLSGGERQRISIARAVLRDPRILILDEATAAMDTQTEQRIQNALDVLSKGRTTIMIAHRLSTLRNADKLIVIDNGRMVEHGTHKELLGVKDGVYNKLYRMQSEALKTIGIDG